MEPKEYKRRYRQTHKAEITEYQHRYRQTRKQLASMAIQDIIRTPAHSYWFTEEYD